MHGITSLPASSTRYSRPASMGQFAALVSSASAALAASSSNTSAPPTSVPLSTAHLLAVLGRQSADPTVRAALDIAA